MDNENKAKFEIINEFPYTIYSTKIMKFFFEDRNMVPCGWSKRLYWKKKSTKPAKKYWKYLALIS